MKIAIIDYGAGNVQSVLFALERLGFQGILTDDWNEIKTADKVIFPGVGEAGTAMKKLSDKGLAALIPTLKQPILGICLGMQLMCKSTQEGNTKGLGIFNVEVIKFTNQVKVPQMGWNMIYNLQSPLFEGIQEEEFMYLVHSFYASKCDESIATTNYETEYSSALQKNNFYGVQFHPEKSGTAGEQILKNFLQLTTDY
ncbi:imidazole glycerol phosphate synthase subunit [Flavobacterium limnosediminis JC2902]|uniref:Imidazole glycerol phosphate synthase subunit HisH n=1 Tax=Flavobacterium limnosediminis JC2902 TaxID=1341181 RepID=V6SKU5_9FLAO|nr:imidazole glycerol phosphate synthase subunit HisH [Flavobacterium limnosediminis]ESU27206.1 imidazole glycerol phosphate synthase subunit [Flavobacterium limnosediminis JC2902]